jgi:transaldolase
VQEAHELLAELERVGVDYDDVTETLEREGVEKFSGSFEELMQSLRAKQQSLSPA